MSKRKTHEEFVSELKLKHPHVEAVTEYKTAKTPMRFRCTIHNYEFEVQNPNMILRQVHGCKLCAIEYVSKCCRKTHEQFIQELHEINPNIIVHDTYKRNIDYLNVECSVCGRRWKAKPCTLLKGTGCKSCATKENGLKMRKSHDDFLKEVQERNPNFKNIIFLSKYTKGSDNIHCKCKTCGNEWFPRAQNLAYKTKPCGCPECDRSKGELCIKSFLIKNSINFEEEKEFDGLLGLGNGKLRYDFYLMDYSLLIEYQGEFHDGTVVYQSDDEFEYRKEHDRRKREYASNHGIDLLEIWYLDFENIEKILSERLQIKT